MSAWDDLPVVGPIGHGAPDWCSVHGDIPGDMSIVAHINATHDMTYEEYRALDQMRADRTGFDSFDDARHFKTGEVAIPAPDERQAGLREAAQALSRKVDWFLDRNIYRAYPFEDEARALRAALDAQVPAQEERLREAAQAFVRLHDEDDGAGWPCDGKCSSVRRLRRTLGAEPEDYGHADPE